MALGIEKIDLYTGQFRADAAEIAAARGTDPEYVREQVMIEERSVVAPWEDSVTLAVNAASRLLTPEEKAEVELLVVGSESGVDFGKPISTWVHRFLELPARCRSFEVKHACYGGNAALRTALWWSASGVRPGKKALVVSTDLTRPDPELTEGFDFIGGGCAVAMLVGDQPRVLEIDPREGGYWTQEIADTFRPTSRAEMGDSQTSLYAYLDALEGAYLHFRDGAEGFDYDAAFRKHVYHAPFPGMTAQAHRTVLQLEGETCLDRARESFRAKVEEGLHFGRRIGTAYGASNFVSLLGLLATAPDLSAGDRVSLFAYGSGCQSEFWAGRIGAEAVEQVRALGLDGRLERRARLDVEAYDAMERERARHIDARTWAPARDEHRDTWRRLYEGEGLLFLVGVRDYYREYGWS
ncbi:MAG TPA: hydroxymethylglutaryl-CoA synthase [Longimicrobiaceae bacterium]|nr:hydroxymethylglutaryl-CoA synthase [Longimicrobiaceae bacterium]